MSDLAIRVENLGKEYRIGAPQTRYRTLRESIVDTASAPFRFFRKSAIRNPQSEMLWALKDVSFEIKRGEVVGVIGRNGAGKSTLLKILSRITDPTGGQVEIHGRVGSLLEVGTGFHPELTGRENIFLNGAILGMRRVEIESKFDEIVAFSEVERFIDTPVKHYSSGMYVRLAFAVAAHLEPEVLIVDEVLAVGEARFQQKCLGKMQDIGRAGRTVLFVSHSMPAVARLCERVLLFSAGRLNVDGPTDQVVKTYLQSDVGTTTERTWPHANNAPGNTVARLHAVRVRQEDGSIAETCDIRRSVGIEIQFWVLQAGVLLNPNIQVFNEAGVCVFGSSDQREATWGERVRPVGLFTSTCWIPGNLLAEGTYLVRVAVSSLSPVVKHIDERDVLAFQVIDSFAGDSVRGKYSGTIPGVIRPLLRWTNEFQALDGHPAVGDGATAQERMR